MSRHTYDVGTNVTMTAEFEDPIKEEAVAPEEVVCIVRTGDHRTLPVEVTEEPTNVFTANVDIDCPGWWFYRFSGAGGFKAAGEGEFEVRDSKVSP